MQQFYIGLDVSLDETSICVVDAKGAIVQELTASSDPESVSAALKAYQGRIARTARKPKSS